MKTILLTGSSGYIATNFIELYKDKYDIIPADKKVGIDVLGLHHFTHYDHIIHLAAISGIQKCEQDIGQTIDDNVISTMQLVNNLNDVPITFASSQAAKDPKNTYAFTKRTGEKYIERYAKNYSILRFSNVYGGKDYLKMKTSVVAKFLNAHLNNNSLVVNGDGSQERDFIHVNDICRAIDKTIETPINTIVDVGTGKGTSVKQLAEMISNNVIHHGGYNDIGVESSISDVTKAKQLLGFKYEIEMWYYLKDFNVKPYVGN
jgi:UDP-glucose 4-epimerase